MRLSSTLPRLAPTVLAVLCGGIFLGLLCSMPRRVDSATSALFRSALAQGSTHFAIADFDGDLQPDFATIRVTRDGPHLSEYSLELKFSSGTRPAIGFIGPAGGLQIFPQDVNGDKFTDLVITSPLDTDFVAILLNDGRGHFTQVGSSNYPNVGKRPTSRWEVPAGPDIREFALGQNTEFLGDSAEAPPGNGAAQKSMALVWEPPAVVQDPSVMLAPGRAPPLV